MIKTKLNIKLVDEKGKPVRFAKKGSMTRTMQNAEAHLAQLKFRALIGIGKKIVNNYNIADWKSFNKAYKIVLRHDDRKPNSNGQIVTPGKHDKSANDDK